MLLIFESERTSQQRLGISSTHSDPTYAAAVD